MAARRRQVSILGFPPPFTYDQCVEMFKFGHLSELHIIISIENLKPAERSVV